MSDVDDKQRAASDAAQTTRGEVIALDGGALQNPAFVSHKRGRNWGAVLSGPNAARMERKFLAARGATVDLTDVQTGAVLEFGGDYVTSGGSLLRDRFPDAVLPPGTTEALYLVDVRDPRRTRALLRDGAWVESDDESGTVTVWGPRSPTAAALASAIAESTGYGVDTLARTASAGKPGKTRRKSAVSEDEAVSLADKWRRRGFSDVSESPAGVRVGLGGRSRLLDQGDHVDLHGPVSDAALRALAAKAAEDWSGSLSLDGPWPPEAQARLWLECKRQGVTLAGYEPPPAVVAAWTSESGSVASAETKLRAVRAETREADLLLSAAADDVAALRRLDPDLRAFVASYLDDDQRGELARADREEVTASLPAFRKLGKVELEREPKAATFVALPDAPAPSDDYERRPT